MGSNSALIRRASFVTDDSGPSVGGRGSAWWTMPTPTSATNVPVTEPMAEGAMTRRLPAGNSGGPPTCVIEHRSACAATSAGCPSSSTHIRVPFHSTDVGSVQPGERRKGIVDLDREPLRARRQRAGAQDHVADEPERAPCTDQQPAQVEPADVLHGRPPGLNDHDLDRSRSTPATARRAPARSRDDGCRCGRPRARRRPCHEVAAQHTGRGSTMLRRPRRPTCRLRSAWSSRRLGSTRCPTGGCTARTP